MKYLPFLLLFLSCNSRLKHNEGQPYSSPDTTRFADWRRDTTGCNGIRTAQYAKQIQAFVDSIKNSDSTVITRLFGVPDDRYLDANQEEHLRYYLGRRCEPPDSDACTLEIIRNKFSWSGSVSCP